MAITRERKEELVAQYDELVQKSSAVFLTEYQGMSVKDMELLRLEVDKVNGSLHVTKNTLLNRVLEEADYSVPNDLFMGQIATGFALDEAAALAKTLVDFARKQDKVKIRGGFLGTRYLTPQDVETLAKLPSLDQLRSQLIGVINAPAQNLVGVVAGGVRQIVNVLDAYAKSEDKPADAAVDDAVSAMAEAAAGAA